MIIGTCGHEIYNGYGYERETIQTDKTTNTTTHIYTRICEACYIDLLRKRGLNDEQIQSYL